MSILESVRAFFNRIMNFIRLRKNPAPPSQLSSSSSIDSESQAITAQIVAEHNYKQFLLQWQNAVMAFCFSSALEIAVLFAQTRSQISVSFLVLSFAILLIFLSLFVANFIGQNFTAITQVLESAAIVLVATTIVFTIAIPLPLSLKCATWTLYAICLFIVLVCRARF